MLQTPRTYRERVSHFWIHTVLHADDPPERIALGAAIGVFVAFTPTVGIQMAIVLFLTWLLCANKAISLPIVWLSNPATIVPIYWGSKTSADSCSDCNRFPRDGGTYCGVHRTG